MAKFPTLHFSQPFRYFFRLNIQLPSQEDLKGERQTEGHKRYRYSIQPDGTITHNIRNYSPVG
jgi:hypothetical protein